MGRVRIMNEQRFPGFVFVLLLWALWEELRDFGAMARLGKITSTLDEGIQEATILSNIISP